MNMNIGKKRWMIRYWFSPRLTMGKYQKIKINWRGWVIRRAAAAAILEEANDFGWIKKVEVDEFLLMMVSFWSDKVELDVLFMMLLNEFWLILWNQVLKSPFWVFLSIFLLASDAYILSEYPWVWSTLRNLLGDQERRLKSRVHSAGWTRAGSWGYLQV